MDRQGFLNLLDLEAYFHQAALLFLEEVFLYLFLAAFMQDGLVEKYLL